MGATQDAASRLGIACDAHIEGRAGLAGTAISLAASQAHTVFADATT
jgi:hypothetical protein